MVLAAMVLLIILFLFMRFLKIVLILGLILLALCGYLYYRAPDKFPENVKNAISEAKDQAEKAVEKSKKVVVVGENLAEKFGKTVEKREEAMTEE
jgi:ABC-type protease/lipase transport system fused ATPase/permease subunit